MKCARFTDEQIIGMLKEQENGQRTADVCRKPPDVIAASTEPP